MFDVPNFNNSVIEDFFYSYGKKKKLLSGQDSSAETYASIEIPTGVIRLVRSCISDNTKISPIAVTTVIADIEKEYTESLRRSGEGEFFKTRGEWDAVYGIKRKTVDAADHLLSDLGVLHTELRHDPYYNAKYWIFNKDRFEDIYGTYLIVEMLSDQNVKPDLKSEIYREIEPRIHKYSEESSLFKNAMNVLMGKR